MLTFCNNSLNANKVAEITSTKGTRGHMFAAKASLEPNKNIPMSIGVFSIHGADYLMEGSVQGG